MRLKEVPPEAVGIKSRLAEPDEGTPEWAVYMVMKRGGKATFAKAIGQRGMTKDRYKKAQDAFTSAVGLGILLLDYVQTGRRGRPYYEFSLPE